MALIPHFNSQLSRGVAVRRKDVTNNWTIPQRGKVWFGGGWGMSAITICFVFTGCSQCHCQRWVWCDVLEANVSFTSGSRLWGMSRRRVWCERFEDGPYCVQTCGTLSHILVLLVSSMPSICFQWNITVSNYMSLSILCMRLLCRIHHYTLSPTSDSIGVFWPSSDLLL